MNKSLDILSKRSVEKKCDHFFVVKSTANSNDLYACKETSGAQKKGLPLQLSSTP